MKQTEEEFLSEIGELLRQQQSIEQREKWLLPVIIVASSLSLMIAAWVLWSGL